MRLLPLRMSSGFVLLLAVFSLACKKEERVQNAPPLILSLTANLIGISEFEYRFSVSAADQELSPLIYRWDFGDGRKIDGGQDKVTHTFVPNGQYTVKVTVSDGTSGADRSIAIDTRGTTVVVDDSKTFQTIDSFGGFGAQNVYWSNGPFTSPRFVNDVVNDLGCTMLRDELPPGFEPQNDNNDPNNIDLTKFNLTEQVPGEHQPLRVRFDYWKALRDAGMRKFIVTVWSPPAWMKWNKRLNNGTTNQNFAPAYNRNPDANSNQLKTEYYEEYAEFCAAFCKVFEQELGFPLYAFGIQNEPRFSQFYNSCVYDGPALRDLLKVVGKRFEREGLKTLLFAPEDVGWFDGIKQMTMPIFDDPEARKYLGAQATHGYAFDGITAGSVDAKTWETMYKWGEPYNIPLWMTETSGFDNNAAGGINLAKAMYTALRFGRVTTWVYWTISTDAVDGYSMMDKNGNKGRSYYVSKQFFRFIRPGAVRIEANSPDANLLPLAFKNGNSETVVITNTSGFAKSVTVTGVSGGTYKVYRTSATDNCRETGVFAPGGTLIVPGNGVVTITS
jgi:glucuronoarabinoxylan endo-1,4-beta-xylanase